MEGESEVPFAICIDNRVALRQCEPDITLISKKLVHVYWIVLVNLLDCNQHISERDIAIVVNRFAMLAVVLVRPDLWHDCGDLVSQGDVEFGFHTFIYGTGRWVRVTKR